MATFTDNFNRADEDPLTAPWATALGNGLRLVANQVNGSTGTSISIVDGETFEDDQTSEIEVAVKSNFNDVGVCVRFDTGGNGYCAQYSVAGDDVFLRSYVAGSQNSLTSFSNIGLVAGDRLKLGVVGNVLTLYLNDVQVGSSYTDAGNTHTSGKAGLWYINGNGNQSKLDNFAADGLQAASIVDVDGDNTLVDGQQGFSITTSGFGSDLTEARLKVGASTVALTGLTKVT